MEASLVIDKIPWYESGRFAGLIRRRPHGFILHRGSRQIDRRLQSRLRIIQPHMSTFANAPLQSA